MRTRVKVCCIASPEEAGMAIAAGADALGLVGAMPSGPGPIPDDRFLLARRSSGPSKLGAFMESVRSADRGPA